MTLFSALLVLAMSVALGLAAAPSAQAIALNEGCGDQIRAQAEECANEEIECPQGQIVVDQQCVTPTPTCSASQTLVAGACVDRPSPCAAGETLVGASCLAPANCSAGQVVLNGVCTTDPNAGVTIPDDDAFVEVDTPAASAVAAEFDTPTEAAAAPAVVRSFSGSLPVTGLAQELVAILGVAFVLVGIGFYVAARGGYPRQERLK
jgi:hypothetical protein